MDLEDEIHFDKLDLEGEIHFDKLDLEGEAHFDKLPDDIIMNIFSYINSFTLLICEQVSKKWNRLSLKNWSLRKSFYVDHLYYEAKQKFDFNHIHFERLCCMLLDRLGQQIRFMQLSHIPHDQPKMYIARGLPMSRSVMRIYLQRINHQHLSVPKWNLLPGVPSLSVPDLSFISSRLNGLNVQHLCLYDVKLTENGFDCLKYFPKLHKLILWPTAVSWNRFEKSSLIEAFDCMNRLKTIKLFTLSPDILGNLPLSVKNLTIHLISTTVARNDEETKNLFQNNLNDFIDLHPDLTNLTVLIRPRHVNYVQLIEYLSMSTKNLRSLKCQYNFKSHPLNLSSLQNLKHFGVQQKFIIGYELDHEKGRISSNIAQTLSSNESLVKLTFKNCYLKNFRRFPSWLQRLNNVRQLTLINVFEAENLVRSLFDVCPNLIRIDLNIVRPLTTEIVFYIIASCKALQQLFVITDDDEDIDKMKQFIGSQFNIGTRLRIKLENRRMNETLHFCTNNLL